MGRHQAQQMALAGDIDPDLGQEAGQVIGFGIPGQQGGGPESSDPLTRAARGRPTGTARPTHGPARARPAPRVATDPHKTEQQTAATTAWPMEQLP